MTLNRLKYICYRVQHSRMNHWCEHGNTRDWDLGVALVLIVLGAIVALAVWMI
jgi:hypothetical protein